MRSAATTERTSRPVVVLHTLRAPDGKTRFVDQMLAGAPDDLRVVTFSWPRALFGRYDIFHVHWPEFLVRQGTVVGRAAKSVLFALLAARLVLTRTPIVRTAHNLEPHEHGGPVEARCLGWLDRRTALWIRLNPTTALPAGANAVTILHGHYRDRFPDGPETPEHGRILQFGLLRKYKGIERLLDVHAELEHETTLRIVGKVVDPSVGDAVTRATAADPRVTARLEFVADADLAREVRLAELVALPYLEMHNSGPLLVALSLDRPVLAPWSAPNEALDREVGPGWVFLYTGSLEAQHLLDALADVRQHPGRDRPVLDGRDWDAIGRQHLAAYRSLLAGPVTDTEGTEARRGR